MLALNKPLTCSNMLTINLMFYNQWVINLFWGHRIYKHYQNITSSLYSQNTEAFGIRTNMFIILLIRLKFYWSNIFLFFTQQNMRLRKTRRASEILCVRVHPSGAQFVPSCNFQQESFLWFMMSRFSKVRNLDL